MSWQGNIIDISLLFISWHKFFQKDVSHFNMWRNYLSVL